MYVLFSVCLIPLSSSSLLALLGDLRRPLVRLKIGVFECC